MIWCQFYIAEDLSEFRPRFRGDDNIMGIGKFLGDKFVTVKPNTGDYYYKDCKSKRYKTINVVYDYELSRSFGYECYHIQLLRDWSYSGQSTWKPYILYRYFKKTLTSQTKYGKQE